MPSAITSLAARLALAALLLFMGSTAAAQARPDRFTVVEEGATGGPDVLLIPGMTSSRAVWAAEAARLRSRYRLHLVQVNGFGGQPAAPNVVSADLLPGIVEQLHAYLAARDLRPVVIGHSLGGLLGLMLAERHPNDVAKLVVVDALPFIGLMFGPSATIQSVAPAATAMRDAMLVQDPARREAAQRSTAQTLALDEGGRSRIVADALASDPRTAAAALLADFQTDLRGELASIRTPTLVLYAFDPTLIFPGGGKPTQAMADAITANACRQMPNVKLVRVDGSRHFIMFDQPRVLAREIDAFLR